MKKLMLILLAVSVLGACTSNGKQDQNTAGGKKDKYGCLVGTGAVWSHLKQSCVQVLDVADIRLDETIDGKAYAAYVILSEDKYLAEVFTTRSADNLILKSVKGGFVSDDNKVRLTKRESGWKLTIK